MIHTHTHTHMYTRILLNRKKNEIMPFAATCRDLEITILDEVSQRKASTIWLSVICRNKMIQMDLFIKQKWTHRHRKQIYGYLRGKGVGRDKLGVWD